MKNKLFILLFSITLFIGCGKSDAVVKTPPVIDIPIKDDSSKVAKQILDANWEISKVSDEIVLKYFHFKDLFTSNQSITVFDIDLNKNVTVDIPYVKSGFLKTSDAALNVRAYVAINGSYFDTTIGGSTVFFRKDGDVINTTRSGFNPYREDAGFSIDAAGKVSIVKKPNLGWQAVATRSLLTSGPLLVYDGKAVNQLDVVFNTARHPRTAVGVTKDNHLIAVVVDGRATQAHGMTTKELATLMSTLGCISAMNLDGGGSSTAWARNRGVVNYPTDNGKFDHAGERGVATVITFKPE